MEHGWVDNTLDIDQAAKSDLGYNVYFIFLIENRIINSFNHSVAYKSSIYERNLNIFVMWNVVV